MRAEIEGAYAALMIEANGPAVVSVKYGTKMIRTGQTITVDGTQGVVVLDSTA